MIFFTSDVHFGHTNILKKFCPNTRQGVDATDMDNKIIHNWNAQVTNNDTVWMLGDIFFHRDPDHCLKILSRINGRLNLVYGNHDKVIRKHSFLQREFESLQEWAEINIDDQQIILHHYPTYEWKNMHRGAYHLYGHIHSRYGELEHPHISGRCMDVGIDSRPNCDMTLWSWPEVQHILSARAVRGHHEKEL